MNDEQNALLEHFNNTIGYKQETHDNFDKVYCVFYNLYGVFLLDEIFKYSFMAEDYIRKQENPNNYSCKCVEVN